MYTYLSMISLSTMTQEIPGTLCSDMQEVATSTSMFFIVIGTAPKVSKASTMKSILPDVKKINASHSHKCS